MTQPTDRPGIDQLRNLADRAERGTLTGEEAARLRDGIDQLEASNHAILKATADLIVTIGYARQELSTALLGRAEAPEDMSLDQIVVDAIAEYRAEQATSSRIRAVLDQHGQTPA